MKKMPGLFFNLCIISVTGLFVSLFFAGCDHTSEVTTEDLPTRTISFETSEGTALSFDISPDGKTIVFDLLGQLWTMPIEGGKAVQITDSVQDTAEDLSPGFSPDGDWIVFRGDRNGKEGLWKISAEGGIPQLLSGAESVERSSRPAWSTEGSKIAYIASGNIQLYDTDRDSTRIIELPEDTGQLRTLDWLPDGRLIVQTQEWSWDDFLGGSLLIVDTASGEASEFNTGESKVVSPAPSTDGRHIAYLIQEEELYKYQIWVQPMNGGDAIKLTNRNGISRLPVRWQPGKDELLYSANGRFWRISTEGGEAIEIPFTAHVEFEREEPDLPQIRFPEPGSEHKARGHRGLAISPQADRIGIIALGKLWIMTIGEEPEPIVDLPSNASRLTWSPDGNRLAWVAGAGGDENLYSITLDTGQIHQLTSLPGKADRPVWSPDGESISFVYWPAPGYPGESGYGLRRFATISANEKLVDDPDNLKIVTELTGAWWRWLHHPGVEIPAWSPESDALFKNHYENARIITLDGEKRDVTGLNVRAAFVNWAVDSSLVYTNGNQLWRAELRDTTIQQTTKLSEDVAIYPSIAIDGTILYISTDGYRILYPDGTIDKIGWPLSYKIPEPPPSMIIKSVRIIDGTGAAPSNLKDVLIKNGRIHMIESAGSVRFDDETEIIEADGRILMPGLIDLHTHGIEGVYPANLYYGVTTVREMGMTIADVAAFRESYAAGIHSGPRVVLGGYQVNLSPDTPSTANYQHPESSEEMLRTLQLLKAFGADFVKMRTYGSPEAGAEFVRKAHSKGMRIGGHCAYPLPLIAAGINSFEHLGSCRQDSYFASESDMMQLFRATEIGVIPTIAWSAIYTEMRGDTEILKNPETGPFINPEMRVLGPFYPRHDDGHFNYYEWFRKKLKSFIPAINEFDILLGAGTDDLYTPGALHVELEEKVDAGLTPLKAIKTATENAAKILGAEQEIGTIEEGKWADLILLDADPLEDIRNTREIWKVIKGGEIVDREAILEWTRESHQMGGQK
jgi:Tol biopolymer transport system component